MSEEQEQRHGITRRDVFVRGGALAAGAGLLGAPGALAAGEREDVSMTFAVITHGAGDAFWVVCKKGAIAAGKNVGVKINYSESKNNPQTQSQLIATAVSQKVKGIATSVPNASAIKDSCKRAVSAGIPIVTLNSGVNDYQSLGAITHVGQTEDVAGKGAGTRFSAAGSKNLLVVIHEQGNIGLEERYKGAKSTFKGKVSRLQVTGVTDLASTTNQIRSKLTADKSIDAVLALNPQVGTAALQAAQGASSKAKIGTFDLSADVIKAIEKGQMLFAIDQQQYLQGYLPVIFLYLYNTNLNTVGGGQPILTGPGFVDKSNAAKVAALAAKATR